MASRDEITLNELAACREDLAKQVEQAISFFELETGVVVQGMELERIYATRLGDDQPGPISLKVAPKLKLF